MKKFIGNTAVKILAVTLSFVVFFTMVVSVVGGVIMLFNDFYTRDLDTLEKSIMKTLAKEEIYNLVNLYDRDDKSLEDYYDDKNVLYRVENLHSGEIISNLKDQEYIIDYSVSEFVTRYTSGEKGDLIYNSSEVEYNPQTDEYYFYATNNIVYKTSQKVEFTVFIPRDMQFTDRFFLVDKLINLGYENRYTFIFIGIISLTLCIVIYSFLFISVGHKNNSSEIKVAIINTIPIDIFTAMVVCIFFYFNEASIAYNSLGTKIILVLAASIFLYFLVLWYILTFVVQVKSKTIIKHMFLYWLYKRLAYFGSIIKHIYKNFATVYKIIIALGVFWSFLLFFLALNAYENRTLIIGFIIICALASVIILLTAIAFQRLKQGGEKISNGDLDSKIDTRYMLGDMKDFANSLNNINQGLQSAIDDKMKSERFKTELITNVSHDIKTPLTSIVNYVDLIKKEDCNNEKINEYIEVLDRQSIRLKKLIEDLVEASKASTGNLTVELTKCDLVLLINQAIGEFSERLEAKGLQTVLTINSDSICILADGRRLWRVFDNLLNNICKYALGGTRVYIDLKNENNKATVTFKNISEQQINVSSEELTERFVRGDRSRNTEGSGLGLSIAKSFTELQNGSFKIAADGDLFKVEIIFDIIN